ncbi:MAG: rhomboid family intramembrane serine protease [Planctomycetota bacterium]|jgi:rhomboid protease GluP|nr:rhomboid family intramembrane serine protease [Planctomycetota bacterium]
MADWHFRENRNGGGRGGKLDSCPACGRLVRGGGEFCPYCARRLRPESGWRSHWRRIRQKPFPATRLLLGLLIGVFFLQFAVNLLLPSEYRNLGGAGGFSPFDAYPVVYHLLGWSSARLVFGEHQYWRLVTYIFLHGGLIHIFFNGWMLRDLGRLAERAWGGREVFAVFVLTGCAGGLASAGLGQLSGHQVNTIGASGAVCGLLGLLLGAEYRLCGRNLRALMESSLLRSCVYIIAFGLLMPGIDNAAHLGGLASGGLLGYFLPPPAAGRGWPPRRKVWDAAALLALAMLAGSWLAAGIYCVEVLLG